MAIDQGSPTVSVCVTTYQHVAFIAQCLESVLIQEFDGSLELLVGDDGSTDGARAIIDAIAARDRRVRVFHHPRNLGPAGNVNFLVAQAGGDAIAHLDGDDYWLAGKLAAQLAVLDMDPSVAAVYCNASVIAPAGEVLGDFNRDVPSRIDLAELLRRGNFLNHSSLLYRASARQAVLGMQSSYIDYRLHVRLLRHGTLVYLDRILVGYRWRTAGSMIRTLPLEVCDGHLDAFEEAVAAGADPSDLRASIGRFWGKVLIHALASRNLDGARHAARKLRSNPALGVTAGWLFAQSLLAIPRAAASTMRRHGSDPVFFP